MDGSRHPCRLRAFRPNSGSCRYPADAGRFGVGGDPYPGGPDVGTFIDPERWDGGDLFMADNNNSIHVVGSTAERIHELRLSNVAFESVGLEPVRPE